MTAYIVQRRRRLLFSALGVDILRLFSRVEVEVEVGSLEDAFDGIMKVVQLVSSMLEEMLIGLWGFFSRSWTAGAGAGFTGQLYSTHAQ